MGTGMGHGNRSRQGMALPLALITVLIISALLGGILMLSVSHLALSGANSSYANALSLAEAGVNWELWKMSWYRTEIDWSDFTVELPPDKGRKFTVHVEADPNPANGLWVISTGLVDGARRTVRVHAEGYGPNGDYALFGIDTLNLGGNFTVVGASGSNGVVNTNGQPNLDGNFWYCGSATGDITPDDPRVTGEVFQSQIEEYFPTVNDIADQWAQDHWDETTDKGIDYFAEHNNNDTICDGSGQLIPPTKDLTIDWKADLAPAGATFPDGTPVPPDLIGEKFIVLGPGDYYFESLRVTSTETLLIRNAGGPVNIWLGPSGGTGHQGDVLTGKSIFFSSESSGGFNVYEGSRRPLEMMGTSGVGAPNFYGSIYAYNGTPGDYWGSVVFKGDANIYGSVVGYDVRKITGNVVINYPSGGGPGEGDSGPIIYYGAGSWEELNGL